MFKGVCGPKSSNKPCSDWRRELSRAGWVVVTVSKGMTQQILPLKCLFLTDIISGLMENLQQDKEFLDTLYPCSLKLIFYTFAFFLLSLHTSYIHVHTLF